MPPIARPAILPIFLTKPFIKKKTLNQNKQKIVCTVGCKSSLSNRVASNNLSIVSSDLFFCSFDLFNIVFK